jgi:hypothetical protein
MLFVEFTLAAIVLYYVPFNAYEKLQAATDELLDGQDNKIPIGNMYPYAEYFEVFHDEKHNNIKVIVEYVVWMATIGYSFAALPDMLEKHAQAYNNKQKIQEKTLPRLSVSLNMLYDEYFEHDEDACEDGPVPRLKMRTIYDETLSSLFDIEEHPLLEQLHKEKEFATREHPFVCTLKPAQQDLLRKILQAQIAARYTGENNVVLDIHLNEFTEKNTDEDEYEDDQGGDGFDAEDGSDDVGDEAELEPRKMKVQELREELERRGRAVEGRKTDLVKRLVEALKTEALNCSGLAAHETGRSRAESNPQERGRTRNCSRSRSRSRSHTRSRSRSRSRGRVAEHLRDHFIEREYIFGITYQSESGSAQKATDQPTGPDNEEVKKLRCLMMDAKVLKSFKNKIPPQWWGDYCLPENFLVPTWDGREMHEACTTIAYRYRMYTLLEMARLYRNEGGCIPPNSTNPFAKALGSVKLLVPQLPCEHTHGPDITQRVFA